MTGTLSEEVMTTVDHSCGLQTRRERPQTNGSLAEEVRTLRSSHSYRQAALLEQTLSNTFQVEEVQDYQSDERTTNTTLDHSCGFQTRRELPQTPVTRTFTPDSLCSEFRTASCSRIDHPLLRTVIWFSDVFHAC